MLPNGTKILFNNACLLSRLVARLILPLTILTLGLSGCANVSTSTLPTFSFGGSSSLSADCTEIESRLRLAHKKYATALGHEKPAVYLTFTGHLSRTMRNNHLAGLHQMTDRHLDKVVGRTRQACIKGNLGYSICAGANRLGRAYKPLVLATREAHENYCGNRPIE